jgi:hypothetical protein
MAIIGRGLGSGRRRIKGLVWIIGRVRTAVPRIGRQRGTSRVRPEPALRWVIHQEGKAPREDAPADPGAGTIIGRITARGADFKDVWCRDKESRRDAMLTERNSRIIVAVRPGVTIELPGPVHQRHRGLPGPA